jgi:hypothetical protein
MADIAMSTKVTTKRTKLPPSIIPDGDGPGLYRVRHADGTLSDIVTLTEAQGMLKASGFTDE